MPVRYSSSQVLKWPSREAVEESVRSWASAERERRPELLRIGYFGSYARGDAGVGSDLDIVAVIQDSDVPFERRAISWDLSALPVPAEIIIYTDDEWGDLMEGRSKFALMLEQDTIWL
jgi:predicted nucleotidyltransferase